MQIKTIQINDNGQQCHVMYNIPPPPLERYLIFSPPFLPSNFFSSNSFPPLGLTFLLKENRWQCRQCKHAVTRKTRYAQNMQVALLKHDVTYNSSWIFSFSAGFSLAKTERMLRRMVKSSSLNQPNQHLFHRKPKHNSPPI